MSDSAFKVYLTCFSPQKCSGIERKFANFQLRSPQSLTNTNIHAKMDFSSVPWRFVLVKFHCISLFFCLAERKQKVSMNFNLFPLQSRTQFLAIFVVSNFFLFMRAIFLRDLFCTRSSLSGAPFLVKEFTIQEIFG